MIYDIIQTLKSSDGRAVYIAAIPKVSRPVVIKLLKDIDSNVYQQLAGLDDRHFPHVYEIEKTDEGLLVAEEYVDGEPISFSDISTAEQFDYVNQICEAVECLHSQYPPIIHRDIKPENVLVDQAGTVRFIDFNSARQYQSVSDDIYSIGDMLSGLGTEADKFYGHGWRKIIAQCKSLTDKERYKSVRELQRDVQRLERTRDKRSLKILLGTSLGTLTIAAIIVFAGVIRPILSKSRLPGTDGAFTKKEIAGILETADDIENFEEADVIAIDDIMSSVPLGGEEQEPKEPDYADINKQLLNELEQNSIRVFTWHKSIPDSLCYSECDSCSGSEETIVTGVVFERLYDNYTVRCEEKDFEFCNGRVGVSYEFMCGLEPAVYRMTVSMADNGENSEIITYYLVD